MLKLLLAAVVSFACPEAEAATPPAVPTWTAAPTEPWSEPTELPAVPEDFVTVEGTFLRVHGPADRTDLLLRLARHGSEALPRLSERLQVPIGNTVHVYVSETDADFRALQPGRVPEWADATAWPDLGAVFLRAPAARGGMATPLETVFDHELVHILVGRAFGDRVPPTWLQEGIARRLAGEVTPDEGVALQKASAFGGLLELESLAHGFPKDPVRARLAYAEAGDFVAWLEETYGDDVLPKLLRTAAGGAGLDESVYKATGHLFAEVDAAWTARHQAGLGVQLASLASGEWLWGAGALGLLWAGVQRRRQFHRRLEEMGREEAELDALVARLRAHRIG